MNGMLGGEREEWEGKRGGGGAPVEYLRYDIWMAHTKTAFRIYQFSFPEWLDMYTPGTHLYSGDTGGNVYCSGCQARPRASFSLRPRH